MKCSKETADKHYNRLGVTRSYQYPHTWQPCQV